MRAEDQYNRIHKTMSWTCCALQSFQSPFGSTRKWRNNEAICDNTIEIYILR